MQRHHLTVDGHRYFLAPGSDADAIGERFVSAAKSGGAVVNVDVAGLSELRVVVTPGAPITIETEEVPDDTGETSPSDAVYFDQDFE